MAERSESGIGRHQATTTPALDEAIKTFNRAVAERSA
jgi:hypothetical protein